MDIKSYLQKLLKDYSFTENCYLINNKCYNLDEIFDLYKKKYAYKYNNRTKYKLVKIEQILDLISQKNTTIPPIRKNYNIVQKKSNEMDNLYFSILDEKKQFLS